MFPGCEVESQSWTHTCNNRLQKSERAGRPEVLLWLLSRAHSGINGRTWEPEFGSPATLKKPVGAAHGHNCHKCWGARDRWILGAQQLATLAESMSSCSVTDLVPVHKGENNRGHPVSASTTTYTHTRTHIHYIHQLVHTRANQYED